MEGKDWAVIIVAFLAPLVAAHVAFGLNRAEQHRRSIRELFYGLKQHVDDFKYAMYALLSHSANQDYLDRLAQTPHLLDLPQRRKEHQEESIATTARARGALSTLNADKSLLQMHYTSELAKPLVDSLVVLTELVAEFLPTQEGGRTPEHNKVRTLPIDATAAQVHEQIDLLWTRTIYPAAISEF